MALLPRFHAPHLDGSPASVTLDPDEAHHLAHVVRVAIGTPVEVFDGRGTTLCGVVAAIGKKSVLIQQLGPVDAAREGRIPLTLAIGWLRTDHMDAVIRDASMLGVRRVQPLFTQRTTSRSASKDTAHVMARWQRIAVGALKQCGGAWLPELSPPLVFSEWLSATSRSAVELILTEPDAHDGTALADVDRLAGDAAPGATLLIGPEGGWTLDEVAAALARGCHAWSLGARVLRADAIPVAAISALRYAWERVPAR
jgi:16S rRNA (uracil1498-N3)-methyltransferase